MSLPGHTQCGVHLTGGLHKATKSDEKKFHIEAIQAYVEQFLEKE